MASRSRLRLWRQTRRKPLRPREAVRRGARHAYFYLGLAGEIEGAAVPQLEAQRDDCGPLQLRDQPFKAMFEEHVVSPEGEHHSIAPEGLRIPLSRRG